MLLGYALRANPTYISDMTTLPLRGDKFWTESAMSDTQTSPTGFKPKKSVALSGVVAGNTALHAEAVRRFAAYDRMTGGETQA